MADDNKENRIDMNENAENIPPEGSNDAKGGQGGGRWYSKPEDMGNKAGDKVSGALSPVGDRVGPVLKAGASPIGGLLEPLAGGVMKAGRGYGHEMGVGFGNEDGGPAKQQEAEVQKLKEPLGGKEQNAENPLGL